jgi:hypothetical protein
MESGEKCAQLARDKGLATNHMYVLAYGLEAIECNALLGFGEGDQCHFMASGENSQEVIDA